MKNLAKTLLLGGGGEAKEHLMWVKRMFKSRYIASIIIIVLVVLVVLTAFTASQPTQTFSSLNGAEIFQDLPASPLASEACRLGAQ